MSYVAVYDCSFCIMCLTYAKKNQSKQTFHVLSNNPAFQLQTPLICELVGLRKAHTIGQDSEADTSFV